MSQDHTAHFKLADAESYDTVNVSFDKFARRFSAPLASKMVVLARVRPGHAVLDLGTGTGIAAQAAAQAVGDSGSVVGLDLSDGMLAVARADAERFGLAGRLRFVKGDAERPDFPDASFDTVLALFALLHLPHPDDALRQMLRVLKPGGSVVIGVGSGPSPFSLPGWFHRGRRVLGLAREMLGKELRATAFLDRLVERALPAALDTEMPAWTGGRGARPAGIPERVQAAGFCDVRAHWEGHIAPLDTAEEFWELQATYSSFARKRLAAAPPETLAALRREFDERCRTVLARGGKLVYPYGAAFFVARPAARALVSIDLSIVVAVWRDRAGLDLCLAGFLPQLDDACEVIVAAGVEPPATPPTDPRVRWLRCPETLLIPELWSRGIERANGRHVAITTAHFEPAPDWVGAVRAAHARLDAAGIGGPIDAPRGGSAKDWATYFLRYSNTFHLAGEHSVRDVPGDNASYDAAALKRHWAAISRGFWEPDFHQLILAEGGTLAWVPAMRVTQRASYPFGAFCRQRLLHGRQFGSSRVRDQAPGVRLLRFVSSPLIPFVFLTKIASRVANSRRDLALFVYCFPILFLFVLVWALGEAWGYLAPIPAVTIEAEIAR